MPVTLRYAPAPGFPKGYGAIYDTDVEARLQGECDRRTTKHTPVAILDGEFGPDGYDDAKILHEFGPLLPPTTDGDGNKLDTESTQQRRAAATKALKDMGVKP